MISQCANPECSKPFRYLRDGRLFQVDRDDAGHVLGREFVVSEGGPAHRLEYFWLCGACAQHLTLVIDPQRGVVPAPLPHAREGQRKAA